MKNVNLIASLSAAMLGLAAALITIAGCSRSVAPAKPNCLMKGEIFVTTKGGDVKKAAGLTLTFVPVTEDFRQSFRNLVVEGDKVFANYMPWFNAVKDGKASKNTEMQHRNYRETTFLPQKKAIGEKAKALFHKDSLQATTGGDGTFSISLPAGDYLLVSEQLRIMDQRIVWCKLITASANSPALVLDQKSAVFGLENVNMHALTAAEFADLMVGKKHESELYDVDITQVLVAATEELGMR